MRVLIVLAVLAGILAGCGGGSSGPKTVNGKVAQDIQTVQAAVESIQTEIGLVAQSATQTNVDQLATDAQQLHNNLSDMKDQVATDAPSNNAGADLTNAVNELKNTMGAVVAYTGNPNPATLASFKTQYDQAISDWNGAVGAIYRGTASTPPSTLGT
jgi:ElaB/YqjD/DUF883 family membrane-anchored ribosome-binding protein